jgi:alkylation response protein AidB-like acyl-CoA dehydrogenase
MTTTPTTERTASDVYEAVRALAPTIAARADEIEADRRLPRDLLDQIVAAGCFRLVRPASHGGLEADWPSGLRVFESLARADASTGWTVMIGSASWCDLVSLPRPSFDALFQDSPDAILAGVFNPSGSVTPDGDSYRVQGRWAFASGCEHADWIYANAVEAVVDGVPHLRGAVFVPDQVVIEDTWDASGLRGTGSHHFHVDAVEVPAARTFVPLSDEPCVDVPLVHVPVPSLFALGVAAIATGVAQAALDDIVQIATGKVPLLATGTLASNPHFQYELACADTTLRAARALVWETAEWSWARAVARGEFTLTDRARIRAAAVWATEHAAAVVDAAYRAGGGSSVYADNPLQRRWRDVHAITQHFLVKPDTLTTAGAVLAGRDVDVVVF